MIKCIIVEDEVLAQQVIQSHLQRIGQFELAGICSNAHEAKALLDTVDVDLIFLDIQLPGMTGLNFLRSLENPPLVVLTTAYSEYALESYEFNVIDYLLKPISFERFSKTVNKIAEGRIFPVEKEEKGAGTSDHIFIKSGNKFFKVNFSEIIYIEGMKDYLRICTTDHKLVTHQTMGEMEKLLPSHMFMRVHKSYIIGLKYIRSIYPGSVELNNTTLPVGNTYKDKVMALTDR